MSDTPETDAAYKNHPWDMHDHIPLEFARKLERERDEWKAAHDNQAKLKRIISDRPDLKERAKLVEELIKERDKARFDLEFRRELYAVQELQLSEARELAANLSVALTAAIKSANARQDETEHAMAERDKAVSSCHIWQDGHSKIVEDRDYWKAEAERWKEIKK